MRSFCTDEMKVWIRKHQGKRARPKLYEMFRAEFGEHFTNGQIRGYVQRYGELGHGDMPSYTPSGVKSFEYFSVKEVAEMFGVSPKTISDRINRGTLKATRLGGRWGITHQNVEKLAEFYSDKKIPWPSVTLKEACALLGYSREDYLSYAVQHGYIDAIKVRKVWFLRKSHIDQAVACLKQTGRDRVPWAKLKAKREAVTA